MTTSRLFLLIAALATLTGCARTGTKTYHYLREVGRVRALYNTDASERIPSEIRGSNPREIQRQLSEAARRIEQYKQTLIGLSADGVDPAAVKFTQDLEAFFDSVKSLYIDTSALVTAFHARNRGPEINPMTVIELLAFAYLGNVRGTVEASTEVLDTIQRQNFTSEQFLRPYVEKVRSDREQIVATRDTLHQQAAQDKSDFTQRFPDQDWTLVEVLPQ
jgi:hypothetical protein